jgi:hypothetical protein
MGNGRGAVPGCGRTGLYNEMTFVVGAQWELPGPWSVETEVITASFSVRPRYFDLAP